MMVQLAAVSQDRQLSWSARWLTWTSLGLLLACASSQECIHKGSSARGVEHKNDTVHSICCVASDCYAGTEPILCRADGTGLPTVRCQNCSPGMYQNVDDSSVRMRMCKPWRRCDEKDTGTGYILVKRGTRKEDSKCGCNNTMNYSEDCSRGECHCIQKWCGKGKQLGSSTGMCDWCPPGHWKATNGHHLCKLASGCGRNQRVVNESTSTSDTVCADVPIRQSSPTVLATTTEILTELVHRQHGTTTIVLIVVCSLLGLLLLVLTAVIIVRCHVYDCGQHQLCKQVASWLRRRPLHDTEEGSDESLVSVASRQRRENLRNSYHEATVDIRADKDKIKQNGHVIQHQVSAVSVDSGCVEGPGNGDLLKGGREVLGRTSSGDRAIPQGNPTPVALEGVPMPQFEVEEEGNPSMSIYEVEEEPNARDSGTDSVGPQDMQASSKDSPMPTKVVIENLVMHGGNVTIGDHALTHIIGGQKVNKTYEVEEEDCVASPFDPAQVHGISGTNV